MIKKKRTFNINKNSYWQKKKTIAPKAHFILSHKYCCCVCDNEKYKNTTKGFENVGGKGICLNKEKYAKLQHVSDRFLKFVILKLEGDVLLTNLRG